MIILGKKRPYLLNIARGAGPGIATAPILTSGAIQRSRAVFVNAGRLRKVYELTLMPLIGQLLQYSGSPNSRGASRQPLAGR